MKVFENGVLTSIVQIADTYREGQINQNVSTNDGGMHAPAEKDYAFYFETGRSAIELILAAMLAAGKASVQSILDMPCGYGRVARHLVAAFPSARLTVCDVDPEMVAFCEKEFGGRPAMSSTDLSQVTYDEPFDLIWCGSLLTHLPEQKFRDALRLFSRSLAPGGIAVVTTHGRFSPWRGRHTYVPGPRFTLAERDFYRRGFGYIDYTEEPSVFTQNYGITLSSAAYVMEALGEDLTIRVVSFTERGWHGHQDVVVFKKQPIME